MSFSAIEGPAQIVHSRAAPTGMSAATMAD
jgi:hypothetical protein